MGVTTRQTGKPLKIPTERIARAVATLAPGIIRERVARGLDVDGEPFAGYSARYRRALSDGGEGTNVDLLMTGGMLGSVRAVDVDVHGDAATVTIAPGTGTSAQVQLSDGVAHRTSRRSPPHNVLGAYLHYGTATAPARPWLGLSSEDRKSLWRQVADLFPRLLVRK